MTTVCTIEGVDVECVSRDTNTLVENEMSSTAGLPEVNELAADVRRRVSSGRQMSTRGHHRASESLQKLHAAVAAAARASSASQSTRDVEQPLWNQIRANLTCAGITLCRCTRCSDDLDDDPLLDTMAFIFMVLVVIDQHFGDAVSGPLSTQPDEDVSSFDLWESVRSSRACLCGRDPTTAVRTVGRGRSRRSFARTVRPTGPLDSLSRWRSRTRACATRGVLDNGVA